MSNLEFLPGIDAAHVIERLRKAGGGEIESGKFLSPESSAALAVNTFGWFVHRPALLPPFPGLTLETAPFAVDVEYCARFPWSGGRHPWLDAIIETPTKLIGVESKRYEPFRDRKSACLSEAYDRPVWGDAMEPYEDMRDRLRREPRCFRYLDAAQLVKHAFGLVTEGTRKRKPAALVYLYAEPQVLAGKAIPSDVLAAHRDEISEFGAAVQGAAVKFHTSSYRDWFATWQTASETVAAHGKAVIALFAP